MADIEAKTEALTEAIYAFTAKMYENVNQQEQEPGSDEVFDADYNIPDDDDK